MAEYLNKLKSILARRESDWAFKQHIVDHIANASEIWRTPYGTQGDRLFHIIRRGSRFA